MTEKIEFVENIWPANSALFICVQVLGNVPFVSLTTYVDT